jgi:hypothetical protein
MASRKRSALRIAIVVIVVVCGGILTVVTVKTLHSDLAVSLHERRLRDNMAASIVHELHSYRKSHGRYPDQLDAIEGTIATIQLTAAANLAQQSRIFSHFTYRGGSNYYTLTWPTKVTDGTFTCLKRYNVTNDAVCVTFDRTEGVLPSHSWRSWRHGSRR